MRIGFRGMGLGITSRTPEERVGTSSLIHDQMESLDPIDDVNVEKLSCLWDIR